jgi:hypothetical protein
MNSTISGGSRTGAIEEGALEGRLESGAMLWRCETADFDSASDAD